MNPLVGKVYLHTVDICHLLVGVHLLHTQEYGVDVCIGSEVDAVFGYEILWKRGTKFGQSLLALCKERKEQGYTYKCVATIMARWLYHTAIALAAYNGIHCLHLRCHVYLSHGRGKILTTMTKGDIAKGTCGA